MAFTQFVKSGGEYRQEDSNRIQMPDGWDATSRIAPGGPEEARAGMPTARRTLRSSHVADEIRQAIFEGILRPGEELRELRLAGLFQVSQATIREALGKLEHLGLVVRVPNRHTRIAQFTASQFKEMAKVRLELEVMAFDEAARRATAAEQEELARLEQWTAGEEEACGSAPLAEWEFHRAVWRISRNTTLIGILEQLAAPIYLFYRNYRMATGPREERASTRKELLLALRMRDRSKISESLAAYL